MEYLQTFENNRKPRAYSARPCLRVRPSDIREYGYDNNELSIKPCGLNSLVHSGTSPISTDVSILNKKEVSPNACFDGSSYDNNIRCSDGKVGRVDNIGYNNYGMCSEVAPNTPTSPKHSFVRKHPVSAVCTRRKKTNTENDIRPRTISQQWRRASTCRPKFRSALEITRFPELSVDPYQQENVLIHILKDRTSIDHNILESTAPYIRAQSQQRTRQKLEISPQVDDPIARALTPNYARKMRRAASAAVPTFNNSRNDNIKTANFYRGGGYDTRSKYRNTVDISNTMLKTSNSINSTNRMTIPTRNERLRTELANISNITKNSLLPADTIYATPCMLDLIGRTININKMNKQMAEKHDDNNRNIILDSKALYNKFTKVDKASILGARIDRQVSVEEIIKNGQLAILNEHQRGNKEMKTTPRSYTRVPKFDVHKMPSIITSELNKNRIIIE